MKLMALHRKLKDEGHITFNRQYLGQLAKEGRIPFRIDDKGRKVFTYLSVLKAIIEGGHININGDTKGKSFTEAKQNLYYWRGKLAKQQHDVRAGILIYREEVEQKAFTSTRVIRDQVLMLPERMSDELSSINEPEKIKEILFEEINNILENFTLENLMS